MRMSQWKPERCRIFAPSTRSFGGCRIQSGYWRDSAEHRFSLLLPVSSVDLRSSDGSSCSEIPDCPEINYWFHPVRRSKDWDAGQWSCLCRRAHPGKYSHQKRSKQEKNCRLGIELWRRKIEKMRKSDSRNTVKNSHWKFNENTNSSENASKN